MKCLLHFQVIILIKFSEINVCSESKLSNIITCYVLLFFECYFTQCLVIKILSFKPSNRGKLFNQHRAKIKWCHNQKIKDYELFKSLELYLLK